MSLVRYIPLIELMVSIYGIYWLGEELPYA
jgi:hypothetical protein